MILPTREQMQQVVSGTEQAVHSEGWDQEPLMFLVEKHRHQVHAKGIGLPLPRSRLGSFIYKMGVDLNQDTGRSDAAVTAMVRNNICAIMVVHEMMTNHDMSVGELADEERDLRDVPGSRETRVVHGMDINGRVFQALRVRGCEPYDFSRVKEYYQSGTIPSGMRLMLMAIARRMPDGLEHVEALSRVRILTKQEVHTIAHEHDGKPGVRLLKEG